MRSLQPFILATLIAFSANGIVATAQENSKAFQRIIDTSFAAHPATNGIIVSVATGNEKIWTYAVGKSQRNGAILNAEQPLLIASNTKTYVAAAILRLQEQKKLNITDPIANYLTTETRNCLVNDGYDIQKIKISHLLSHTSGIADYVDDGYFDFVNKNKKHRWTRKEQIVRATTVAKPLAAPQDTFQYADINYLLLTEMIEHITKKPFYTAIRELDKFETLGLNKTWFQTLEKTPQKTFALAHQYWNKYDWDTYDLDPSWDLYGGGGIAATNADLTRFFKYLFEGKIVADTAILSKMYTDVPCKTKTKYCMGMYKFTIAGMTAYYHGGFWGTDAIYFPELKTAISITILEKSERDLSSEICKAIAEILKAKNTK